MFYGGVWVVGQIWVWVGQQKTVLHGVIDCRDMESSHLPCFEFSHLRACYSPGHVQTLHSDGRFPSIAKHLKTLTLTLLILRPSPSHKLTHRINLLKDVVTARQQKDNLPPNPKRLQHPSLTLKNRHNHNNN